MHVYVCVLLCPLYLHLRETAKHSLASSSALTAPYRSKAKLPPDFSEGPHTQINPSMPGKTD